jgi:hypothetical protein
MEAALAVNLSRTNRVIKLEGTNNIIDRCH